MPEPQDKVTQGRGREQALGGGFSVVRRAEKNGDNSRQIVYIFVGWSCVPLTVQVGVCPGTSASVMAGDASTLITKRLHISGLTSQFNRAALSERLSSFGTVLDLEGSDDSYVNAVGERRPYAFVTLRTTPQQLAKCMNTLSGAVWKGAKLRVGEAKPPWHERLAAERTKHTPADEQCTALEKRKKQLRKRPWIGMEAHDMRPMTLERVNETHAWGWKSTPAGHLIRPMHMRPSHPIPKPADHEMRANHHGRHALSRAPRVTIDPTRYHREHLSERMFDAMTDHDDTHLHWVWDVDAHEWFAYNEKGHCVGQEAGPARRTRPIQLPLGPSDTCASSGVHRMDSDGEEESLEPTSPSHDVPDALFDQSEVSGELFDTPPQTKSTSWWDEPEPELKLESKPAPSRSPTPERPSKASGQHLDSMHDREATYSTAEPWNDSDFSDGYEETEHAPASSTNERERALGMLQSMFGSQDSEAPEPAESSSILMPDEGRSEVHAAEEVRPLAGEGNSSVHATLHADQIEGPTTASAPSSSTVLPARSLQQQQATAHDAPAASRTADGDADGDATANPIRLDRLKDMFQPTEESGAFTLFGDIDEENMSMDDDAVAGILGHASARTESDHTEQRLSRPPTSSTTTAAATTHIPPFTTPFTLSQQIPSLLPTLFQLGSTPFWQVDSDEAIRENWLAKRSELTQTYRSMHRDAIKKRRRRVAGSRAAGAEHGGSAPIRGVLQDPSSA